MMKGLVADHDPGDGVHVSGTPAGGYLSWIEAARTPLMAGVVLVHTDILAIPRVDSWWPFQAWSCLPLGLLVPAFFMISGLVVGLGDVAGQRFNGRRFLRRKLYGLVLPFFVWNAIMTGLHLALEIQPPMSTSKMVLSLLTGYLHLYFVAALLQCLGLVILVRPLLAAHRLRAILVSCAIISAAFYGLASLLFWTGIRPDGWLEDTLDRSFLPWCFYFFLGVWLGQSPKARAALGRLFWLFGLLTLAVFPLFLFELEMETRTRPDAPLLQFLASGFPFQVLGALAYVGLFERLGRTPWAERPIRLLARFAPLSLGIYLCHNAVLFPLLRLWTDEELPMTPSLIVPVLASASFLLSMLAAYLGQHLGWPGRVLFVLRRPSDRALLSPSRKQRSATGASG
jgi:surface polysaccharide O-acyltransferase-like enzyme